jgi:hypothetical protein
MVVIIPPRANKKRMSTRRTLLTAALLLTSACAAANTLTTLSIAADSYADSSGDQILLGTTGSLSFDVVQDSSCLIGVGWPITVAAVPGGGPLLGTGPDCQPVSAIWNCTLVMLWNLRVGVGPLGQESYIQEFYIDDDVTFISGAVR